MKLLPRDQPHSGSSPSSTFSSRTSSNSIIPLWDQCGLARDEVCAGGAQCICKDQWWSQCRVPINGSWFPDGETWQCAGGEASISASPKPSAPMIASISRLEGIMNTTVSSSPLRTSRTQSENTVRSPASSTSDISMHSPTPIPGVRVNMSSTSTSSLRGSAYANPIVLSIIGQLSSFSLGATASAIATAGGKPSGAASGLSQPSSTSMLPNLACPSNVAIKEGAAGTNQDSAVMQACNPTMLPPPGNFSSTVNSSSTDNSSFTPDAPPPPNLNPDKNGTYLEANETVDHKSHCLNFAAHQYQICWEVLNVTGYLQDWVAFNHEECDREAMGFADCFLYVEVGAGANCSSFTGRSQCPVPDSRIFVGRTNGAPAYYVAFNIWNIQNWFFTYYIAVSSANGLSADSVGTIARTLNLPQPKKFPVLELLAGIAFAFGLLSPSGYAATLPALGQKIEGFGAQAPGEYLLRAIQNSPTLSRNLLDKGDLTNSDVQIAELGSDLARIVAQLETNIQNAVVLVMSNFSLFYDFVQDGFFSTQIENLNTIAQNVTLSLNTYIVSQALQDDQVIITRALNTDINELQLNGSAVQYDTGCGHGYDEWGMCSNWWYDSTNRISYGLESMKNMLNNYTDPLESLFNQGITTPELLFMNSQFCADAAGSTQGNAPGTSLSTTTGVWNTECISNLKICTWDVVNMGVFHEYTDCDRESSFAMEECGDGEGINQATVPASYIGPWLTSWEFQGIVCNKWGKGMGSPG